MTLRRWPLLVGPLIALASVPGLRWSAAGAAERLRQESDAALARAAVAYLTVVTPPGTASGYDAARLLSAAHTLGSSSFWRGGLQVSLGTAPLLPDTVGLLPVPDSVLVLLDRGAAQVAVKHARVPAMLVPLLDRDRWATLGWAAAWGTLGPPHQPLHTRVLTLAAVLGVLFAALAFLQERDRRWRGIAFISSLGAIALLALDLAWTVQRTARTATDTRLLTIQRLVEIAATAPGVRQAALPGIASGVAVQPLSGPVSPSEDVVRGSDRSGPFARVEAATPRSQGGLRLSLRPLEADLGGLRLTLAGWVLLAAASLGLTAWTALHRNDPRKLVTTLSAWGFLAPALGHLLLFSLLPALFTLYLAFHRWDLLAQSRPFVGLANFGTILGDTRFLHSLGVTAIYSLHVPVTLVLALGVALLLNRQGLGVRLLRVVLFVPFVSSVVAVALVWQWLYQPDNGLLNAGLRLLGLPGPDWLGDPRTALPSLMLMSVWVQVGYQMVVFLGGLQAIPVSYLDAARVDGASRWQRFWWVTLPLLRPTLLFVLVTGVIGSFQVFTYVAVMTDGGPLAATDVAVFRIYQEAWEFLRFGTASAMSLVLLVLLLGFTWLQFRWLGRRVDLA